MAEKIPLWNFIAEAHRLLWRDRAAIARFAAPWFILLVTADAALEWSYFSRSQLRNVAYTWPDHLYSLATIVLPLTIGAIVAVQLHRYILLPSETTTRDRPTAPADLVAAYLGRTIAIQVFIFGLVALIIIVVDSVLGTEMLGVAEQMSARVSWSGHDIILVGLVALVFVPACYLPVRLSLALPATAIGSAQRAFAHSWPATRGHFWRLFGGGFVSYWPAILIGAVTFPLAFSGIQMRLPSVAASSAATAAAFLSELIWVGFFSLAYRHITSQARSDDALTSHPELGDGDG